VPRSFDKLARVYRLLERISFGNRLELARSGPLKHLAITPESILLLGDGDGRFCQRILSRFENANIVSIDSSQKMIECARERLIKANLDINNVRFVNRDIRSYEFPKAEYDLIALNFVLDCFTQQNLNPLLPKIEASLEPGGFLVYSDFAIPDKPAPKRLFAKIIVTFLYLGFRATTDIQSSRLPNVRWGDNLELINRSEHLAGVIVSELRRKQNGFI